MDNDGNKEGDLSKRISLLERKLVREKSARLAAEEKLEQISLEIYEANESLKTSLKHYEQSAIELKFLNEMSSEVSSDSNLVVLLETSIELISRFLDATIGFQFSKLQGDIKIESVPAAENSASILNDTTVREIVSNLLKSSSSQEENRWLMNPIESAQNSSLHWFLSTRLELNKDHAKWLGFLLDVKTIDPEFLYVLDTARAHIQTGIRRRLNDERIILRNRKLQETIENLENTKKQLFQSEKMASLGQMAAGVAHEINNPIGFIQSNMQSLKEYIENIEQYRAKIMESVNSNTLDNQKLGLIDEELDIDFLLEDADELIKSNLDGTKRVCDIVSSLRSFSHSGDGQNIESLAIKTVIDSALKIVWNSLKYDHTVNAELPDNLPKVKGDKGRLQQVFINLFVNAAQAMPDGGVLTISATLETNQLRIDVSDTGIGMDKNTIAKLFTPFFTTKPVGQGTGLGLSVSYAILEAHGVTVDVESEVGKGTTFKLFFPID
jgi:signal transduction histidine kinase